VPSEATLWVRVSARVLAQVLGQVLGRVLVPVSVPVSVLVCSQALRGDTRRGAGLGAGGDFGAGRGATLLGGGDLAEGRDDLLLGGAALPSAGPMIMIPLRTTANSVLPCLVNIFLSPFPGTSVRVPDRTVRVRGVRTN